MKEGEKLMFMCVQDGDTKEKKTAREIGRPFILAVG
jgi:hypothetical protein